MRSKERHTFIDSSNCKSNKDITEDDKVRRQIRIPLKQTRLFRLDNANSVMYQSINDKSESVEHCVLCMQ